ncbi:MAG: ATP-dependent zinc protease [Bacteroidota bacterium]
MSSSSVTSKSQKPVIGRSELVDFPKLDLLGINARVDTGAYTSSLHAHRIEPYEKDGEAWVKFNLLDPSHEEYNDKLFNLPVHDVRVVKSSNGISERRYIIKTSLKLFNQLYDVELSLTDRTEMKYPVLLGRKLLMGRFIVDVSKVNCSHKALHISK